MNILVTGGAGYIGSHTAVELLQANHNVIIVDNLSNSSKKSIKNVAEITNKSPVFYISDLRDKDHLDFIFKKNSIDAVIHFAGLKAVGESVKNPLLYYQNNLESTLALLECMSNNNVKKLVFSSSATVYGDPAKLPITEDMPKSATNPYGQTKLIIEQILEDLSKSGDGWNFTSLRYFNPIGAHESGKIGEDPNGIPNNLMPYVAKVASGELKELSVYGNDYDTIDGTGVRDYIHVVDLARAHLAALDNLNHPDIYKAYNIGTGKGYSVLEIVKAFERASGKKIPYIIAKRRQGDVASCYSDPTLAKAELGWNATHSIDDACSSLWKWQSENLKRLQ